MDFSIITNSISQVWSFIEPLAWLAGVSAATVYWCRLQRAKRRRFADRNGKQFVIALQIGRPVGEAVKAHFGKLDCLVDIQAVLGKGTLETARDYRDLAQEIYRAMAQNQHCPIKLVLSDPVGLSFLIGQLVGLHHFDVEVYQFDPASKGYQALPAPDRAWLDR